MYTQITISLWLGRSLIDSLLEFLKFLWNCINWFRICYCALVSNSSTAWDPTIKTISCCDWVVALEIRKNFSQNPYQFYLQLLRISHIWCTLDCLKMTYGSCQNIGMGTDNSGIYLIGISWSCNCWKEVVLNFVLLERIFSWQGNLF